MVGAPVTVGFRGHLGVYRNVAGLAGHPRHVVSDFSRVMATPGVLVGVAGKTAHFRSPGQVIGGTQIRTFTNHLVIFENVAGLAVQVGTVAVHMNVKAAVGIGDGGH